jgi:pimeloyl-ACP methyl ester carboxylesterase
MTRISKIDRTVLGPLYPFQPHYLPIGPWRMHYLDEGRGEPLLMVHGNPTWSFYFRRLVTAFRDAYRTIVPDHLGCGLSDVPTEDHYGYRLQDRIHDLGALVDHLQLSQPITLVLHDWGGMIGLAWALRHVERIGRVIVLNTAAFFPPAQKRLPIRLRLIRDLGLPSRLAVLGGNLFALGAVWMAPQRRLSAAVRRGLLAPYNRPRNRLATLKFVQDIPLKHGDPSTAEVLWVERHLGRLAHVPILILWGAHDFVFDDDYLKEWLRRFPQAENHRFADAGHYLLEDVPEKIIALMADFLRRHPL